MILTDSPAVTDIGMIMSNVGVVAIGRNEGERLVKCLESVARSAHAVVYVDSGSTDDSVTTARSMGIDVIDLDLRIPFTAARARNEGFQRLHQLYPKLTYVQFVDGDCEIADNWILNAAAFLEKREDVAVVCGRLREKNPDLSIYNTLCDIEWDRPAGNIKACGGIAMMRIEAFRDVGGFRADLVAGEEPELCVRLRLAGWKIWRVGEDMALHDAAMTRFGQWWKRAIRAGFAYAQGAHLHGGTAEQHGVHESRSAWVWGFYLPVSSVALAVAFGPWAFLPLLIYPLQITRVALQGRRTTRENCLYAFFIMLGKIAEALGQIKFVIHKWSGRRSRLIEYK